MNESAVDVKCLSVEDLKESRLLHFFKSCMDKKVVRWKCKFMDFLQGINGILADEMGLGKTVQSIALLAHLAEVSGL